MTDLHLFSTLSTAVAALAIALGTMLPAIAMGKAIASALEALARQPEAEKNDHPYLVHRLGDDRIAGDLLLGRGAHHSVPQSIARILPQLSGRDRRCNWTGPLSFLKS